MARAKSGSAEGRHGARPKKKTGEGGSAERLCLTFGTIDRFETVTDPIHRDLSTATRHGEVLFMSCDETAGSTGWSPTGLPSTAPIW
jgi:hypothetical protein